jgi:hypothetical protein
MTKFMKKLFLLFTASLTFGVIATNAQTARVMAIHNSPDTSINVVDVWLVTPAGDSKIADDFAFRQSTGFIDAPAGLDIRICFAPANSTNISDTLSGFGYNLNANETYVLLAQGIVSNTGFTPAPAFGLKVIQPKERISGTDSVYLSIIHGSTDAPPVDIIVRSGDNEITKINNIAFGNDVTGAVLPTGNYIVDLYVASSNAHVTTVPASLQTLGLNDSAVVVFASGFVNPSQNSNGEAFGVFAALSNGLVVELAPETFKLQAFHACADSNASLVDVYVKNATNDSEIKLADFAYGTATPYLELPANQNLSIIVAPAGSSSSMDGIYNLNVGSVNGGAILFGTAMGVLDTANFEANPNGINIGFGIVAMGGQINSGEAGKVSLNVVHAATDAPAVDVKVADGPTLFSNVSYSEFGSYIDVDPADYTIQITPAGESTVVASYSAPLAIGFTDSAIVVVAAGFLSPNTPEGKDAGPAFGLYAVTPSGMVIALPTIPAGIRKTTEVKNTMYPNPAKSEFTINSSADITSVTMMDLTGRIVKYVNYTNVTNNNKSINVNDVVKGIYLITIETTNGTTVQKLIVE